MITLNKFEHLIMANIAQKPQEVESLGNQGQHLNEWVATLSGLNKHEQYAKLKVPLSELLVATLTDKLRLTMMDSLLPVIYRTIEQLHADYIYEHQSLSAKQQSINEVRSLYFLMILVYKNIASRAYIELHNHSGNAENWLSKLIKTSGDIKELLTVAVYRMMALYVGLLREYALTYERVPRVIWQQLNFWYLRSVHEGIAKTNAGKLTKTALFDSVHAQYKQACIASFANFFAYRRQDIVNIFKVLPAWTQKIDTTFEPRPELRIFVNLSGNHPPEVITPYATVNPYSEEYQCLFFDVAQLIDYLKAVRLGEYVTADAQSMFEVRLAKMVLLAFYRRARQDRIDKIGQQKAELLTGFYSVFHEISAGKQLSEIINQRALPTDYHAKALQAFVGTPMPKEPVKITSRNEWLARFDYQRTRKKDDNTEQPFLQVFGLFALKSVGSTHKRPWRLGIAHWVDCVDEQVEVDGRFIGRILLAVGVRLRMGTGRSQNFVHALLIEGDELSQQSTLVTPCYHFKVGDVVVLRIGGKEMELRLEQCLLSTDEIEQYQIVRLNG
ncbi:MAG: hypothetical protein Q4A69_02515 [Moraxella sp.]|nr:hypothetical protein [Moraxella sp.]